MRRRRTALSVRLADHIRRYDRSVGHADRGRAYEEAACEFLGAIPGVTIGERNVHNTLRNHEIDIALVNARSENGLHFLPSVLLTEVKGWERRLGSHDISWFASKLRDANLSHGLLFAATGLTGDFTKRTAGHAQLASALKDGQAIIVITRPDLVHVASSRDAVLTVQRRLLETIVGRLRL